MSSVNCQSKIRNGSVNKLADILARQLAREVIRKAKAEKAKRKKQRGGQ